MTKFGKKIKEIRLKRSLSQEDLADAANVNLRTIQRIENNETTPRRKTLELIFEALDVEIIEIENTQKQLKINNYFVWATFLTLLVIVGTFINWFEFVSEYGLEFEKKGPMTYSPNGWGGKINISFIPINFYNWLVSICSISIAGIVICNSLKFIKKKPIFIIIQSIYISFYLFVLISVSIILDKDSKYFSFKPGIFIVVIATILLIISYLKKNNEKQK